MVRNVVEGKQGGVKDLGRRGQRNITFYVVVREGLMDMW